MQLLLCNRGHPEYGQATIPFPIPDEEYDRCIQMLQTMEIGSVMGRDCYVDQVMNAPPVLDFLEGTCVNVDEMDFLARSMDRYTADELAKFQAVIDSRGIRDMAELINFSFCCEKATVITSFADLESVGKSHYLDLHMGIPTEDYQSLNGEGIARGLIASGQGKVTPYGVLYENDMEIKLDYLGMIFPAYYDRPGVLALTVSPQDDPGEGTLLQLPMPAARLQRLLERGGLTDTYVIMDSIFEMDCSKAAMDILCPEEKETITQSELKKLNDVCRAIYQCGEKNMVLLSAVTQFAKPTSPAQLRVLAENLGLFDFVSDIYSAEDYGKYLIQESGHYSFDEDLSRYYDYDKCGRERMESECGGFVENGYVSYHGTMALDELMMGEPTEQEQGQVMGSIL